MSSAFTGSIKLQQNNVLQRRVVEYDPSAAQALTTTHADVAGSDIAFTPVSANSKIVYRYAFHLGNADIHAIAHFKLLVDGTLEAQSESTAGIEGYEECFYTYEHSIDSWGTSEKTIKMQAREFSAAYDAKLHEGNDWDGSGTPDKLKNALLTVTEYAGDWTPPDYSDPVAGDTLQRIVQEYDPSAAQQLTTTHADINGSDYAFTPVSASSNIVYEFDFTVGAVDQYTCAYVKLFNDGVLETESETVFNGGSVGIYDIGHVSFSYVIQSWGTSAQTLKLQAREHNTTNADTKLHESRSWDGVTSSKLRRAVLDITEIAT